MNWVTPNFFLHFNIFSLSNKYADLNKSLDPIFKKTKKTWIIYRIFLKSAYHYLKVKKGLINVKKSGITELVYEINSVNKLDLM